MKTPFTGMDPYLEHPALWPDVHVRLMVGMARQLAPRVRPRYVVALEQRVYVEEPSQQRVPDVLLQKTGANGPAPVGGARPNTPLVLEVEQIDVEEQVLQEAFIEIRDTYQKQRVVTVLELLSPTNKTPGPGRDAYLAKRLQVLLSETHLTEIDLLRSGRHTLSVPRAELEKHAARDYRVCVNRSPQRKRFEVYAWGLREPLPAIAVPLAAGDTDVTLDLQAAFEDIYSDAGFELRVRYDEPCDPPLSAADQSWATEQWQAYKASHPEWFPPRST